VLSILKASVLSILKASVLSIYRRPSCSVFYGRTMCSVPYSRPGCSVLYSTPGCSVLQRWNSIYFNMSAVQIAGMGEAKPEGMEEGSEQIRFVT
jgi:hypothetical protein